MLIDISGAVAAGTRTIVHLRSRLARFLLQQAHMAMQEHEALLAEHHTKGEP